MRSDGAWDRDPVPDPLLRRLVGRVSVPPLAEQDAARLEAAIMSAVRRYPGDAVLASLISGDDSDTLSPWSEP